jgi:hypothetical protein
LGKLCWRLEGKRSSVLGTGGFHCGNHFGGHQTCTPWFTTMRLKLKHVARNGDRSTAVKVIRSTDELGGKYGKLSCHETQLNPGAKIFTCLCFSSDHGARITTISAHRDGERLAVDLMQILYHGIPYSVSMTERFETPFPPNFQWQQVYWPVTKLLSDDPTTILL